jgi:hypothetical protein
MTTPAPEDHRRSLADLAQRDLDAALQLLAERAQYITAASGAAIALRRGDHHDMLCRASAGSNAPELGAILSMDYGLSGESVRTRQLLRCDDVSTDSRVNHEVCRRLGIASVVVMPIVSDDQTLGVFELLSGKPRAFEERDLSALRRLSELVEHAVKHAILAHYAPSATGATAPEATAEAEPSPTVAASVDVVERVSETKNKISADPLPTALAPAAPGPAPVAPEPVVPLTIASEVPAEKSAEPVPVEKSETIAPKLEPLELEPAKLEPEKLAQEKPDPVPAKPRFWSVATHPDSPTSTASAESNRVPPGLRNLRKCQTCGFPVSPGRTYCVECEEKQWRGQPLTKPVASSTTGGTARAELDLASQKLADRPTVISKSAGPSKPDAVPVNVSEIFPVAAPPDISSSPAPTDTLKLASTPPQASSVDLPLSEHSTLFSNSAAPSESWFAANRYVLIALLAVAIVIAAIAFLR